MKNVIRFSVLAGAMMALAAPVAAMAQSAPSDQLPMQARPGQCFQRILVPATWRPEPFEVITAEGYETIQVTQAQFRARQETVVTRDEHKRYVVTEPVFRTEGQTIVTRPAFERLVATAPSFGTRSETVLIREPRLVWRRGADLSGIRRLDPNTGEVYCLVEEPAVTQTVTRRVVTAPGQVRRETVPAQTQTIPRQVLVTPASVREVMVPAQTAGVTINEMVSPATESRVSVPEVRSTINRQVLASGERYEWVAVVCESTPSGVTSITQAQRALASRGYYRGPIDGIAGPMTADAARRFQRDQRIPGNGSLTLETLRRLGVN
jgi:hypothetical protein